MKRSETLAKNTIIIFLGTLCTKFATFLLLPLYTSYLTTDEYGLFELINTIIMLIVPIVNLQIDQGVFRYLISERENEETKKELISTSFYFILITTVISLIIFFMICPFINSQYKYLIIGNIVFNSLSALFLQISRGIGKNTNYALASFIIATLTIILNILFICAVKLKVDGLLISSIIGYCVGIVYLIASLKLKRQISIKYFKLKQLKRMLKYSLPLIPSSLSWWVFSVSDRVIISIIIGLSATGILSVSYKLSNIFIIIYNVFNMSITESIALHINDNDIGDYYNKVFKVTSELFLSIGLALIAYMPILFKILINNAYAEAYNLIPIAIVASMLQVIVGLTGTLYAAKNNTKALANTAIISAVINIIVNLGLIKYIGIYAAVISTFVSYLIFTIYRLMDINKRYFKITLDKKKNLIFILNTVISCIIYYYGNLIFKSIGIIYITTYIFIYNKNNIKLVFELVNKNIKKYRSRLS